MKIAYLTQLFTLALCQDKVQFQSVSLKGSACESASIALTDDKRTFTVIFDSFIVTADDDRAKCIAELNIIFPKRCSRVNTRFDYRGFASLDDNLKSKRVSNYGYSNGLVFQTVKKVIVGPFSDDYIESDEITVKRTAYHKKPISKVKIDITASLKGVASVPGQRTIDALDGSLLDTLIGKYQC
ncbi:hypothetical protein BC833DRAFT_607174 [Globomyces pollinis-pini]|nr:hypothetical protein BC833DRAFT_607174 [Globomyces pollinis-pini]KAJ2989227.1 hypothetical protein HDV02_005093 [Globomyces sp. JEL0801]